MVMRNFSVTTLFLTFTLSHLSVPGVQADSCAPSAGMISVTNGDFSDGLTGWTPWTVQGQPVVFDSANSIDIRGDDFVGGAWQQFDTCGPGTIVTVTARWFGQASASNGYVREILAVNSDRAVVNGSDEIDGQNDAILLYRSYESAGGPAMNTSALPSIPYRISFTAAANSATIILRTANTGGAMSMAVFDDIDVRCVPAAATLAELPEGFARRSLAFGVGGLAKMAQSPINKDLYVIKNDGNATLYRVDLDGENLTQSIVANMRNLGLEFDNGAEGLTFDANGNIYAVSHEGDIIKGTYNPQTEGFAWSTFLDLPEDQVGGWHGVNGSAIDNDAGHYYLCSGTTKNEKSQPSWWIFSNLEGRVLRFSLDPALTPAQRLATVETFAPGIRNTFGITFRVDGKLFGVDNSPDPQFNCDAADEFNLLEAGKHYGWPYNYGSDLSGNDDSFGTQCTIDPPGPLTNGPSLANFGPDGRPASGQPGYVDGGVYYGVHPHSSPDGITFYEPCTMDPSAITFPPEFHGRAFVARFGATGNDVLSMRLAPDDTGYVCNRFLSGLSNAIDVLAGHNGRLYVLEYGSGSNLHEIRYTLAGPCADSAIVKPDFDCDGDVDQTDFGVFQACMSGPGNASTPACTHARLDGDLDVDNDDFDLFIGCVSGADVPATETCDDDFSSP